MNFHYPNGKQYLPNKSNTCSAVKKTNNWSFSNRGMTLEDDLNQTNNYYLDREIAVIHKKPTPIQIVQVDYPKRSAAVIKEAYFQQPSTTDYNGIYKGKYIDFEAKETQNRNSFPLKNFHEHQIRHMKAIVKQEGICFVIIRFTADEQIYLLEAKHLFTFWERMENGGRKSITKSEIEEKAYYIPLGFQPRIDYIKIIDKLYGISY